MAEEYAQLKKENERLKNRRWAKAYKALDIEHRALKREANRLLNKNRALQQRNAELDAKSRKLASELKGLWKRAETLVKDVRDSRSARIIYKVLYDKCVENCPAAK